MSDCVTNSKMSQCIAFNNYVTFSLEILYNSLSKNMYLLVEKKTDCRTSICNYLKSMRYIKEKSVPSYYLSVYRIICFYYSKIVIFRDLIKFLAFMKLNCRKLLKKIEKLKRKLNQKFFL